MIVHNQRQFYIDGEWVDPLEPSNLEVINPATEESAATISVGTFDDGNHQPGTRCTDQHVAKITGGLWRGTPGELYHGTRETGVAAKTG